MFFGKVVIAVSGDSIHWVLKSIHCKNYIRIFNAHIYNYFIEKKLKLFPGKSR